MPETILAFDFGNKRIGIAVGNTLLRSAQALKTIETTTSATRYAALAVIINQWRPQRLVVGIPYHVDGSAHSMTRSCQQFAQELHTRFSLPIEYVDERYSSTQASQLHRERRQAGLAKASAEIDHLAAAVILERYFSTLE